MKKSTKYLNIGIFTFGLQKSGVHPLSSLIECIAPHANEIYLITGDAGYTYFKDDKRIKKIYTHNLGLSTPHHKRFIYILINLPKIAYDFLTIKNIDMWLFYHGGILLAMPMFIARFLRKKVVYIPTYSAADTLKETFPSFYKLLDLPLRVLLDITYLLPHTLILYSPNLIKEWNLEKYKDKILIAHEHFLDFSKFEIKKKLSERNNLVGYIGRLSEEKGILNFVKAIPEILNERDDLEFLIGGDGQLRDEIEKYINEKNLNDKVKLVGWIPHGNLPDHLNELKLVVLPSYTEGLPNIMLEAMACSTPVLATPVGGVPDVIKDGETGFIMENNLPEHIARNVIRALNHPNQEKIAENARALVEMEFTYEKAVEKYRKILDDL